MDFKLIAFISIIIFNALDSGGQGSIKNLTTNDGLSQNNVTQLLFDEDHYLWVGTNSGLCVYNGKSFYNVNQSNLSPRISHIFMDKKKELYIIDEYKNLFKKKKLTPIKIIILLY